MKYKCYECGVVFKPKKDGPYVSIVDVYMSHSTVCPRTILYPRKVK